MRKYNKDDYLFACAGMVYREKYLLTQEKIDKMLESKTPDEAMKVLFELDYGEADESVPATEFESLLSGELKKTYDIIKQATPEQAYFEILLYPNDYHNVKALLKAEFLGINASELLVDAGSIPVNVLIDMVRNRDFINMRTDMAKAISEVLEIYALTQDPQVVDLILDKACFNDMSLLAKELEIDFIKEYLALKIDVSNLITFIRLREIKRPREFFSKVFIENGNISENVFLGGYDEAMEQFAEKLAVYGLRDVLFEGAAMIKATGRFTELEKLCDNVLMAYIDEAKYMTTGIEPLFAYFAAKESEIKTIRIIMAGKLAGISTDMIRERIRDTYV